MDPPERLQIVCSQDRKGLGGIASSYTVNMLYGTAFQFPGRRDRLYFPLEHKYHSGGKQTHILTSVEALILSQAVKSNGWIVYRILNTVSY